MPKGSRGGRRATVAGTIPVAGTATPQQAQNILQDLADGDTVSFSDFMSLSEDDKADAIATIMTQDLPNFLDNSVTQKLLYYTELDAKPQVVADNVLDSMPGISYFRTVNKEYNSRLDVNYTAKDIYNQITKGDFTRVSSSGGSAYGKGIYFADDYYHSARGYGRYNGTNGTLTMRMKFNSNRRPITDRASINGYQREIRNGTKLGRVLRRIGSQEDRQSVYALVKGYNVINGGSYQSVLDRGAITMSSRTTNGSGTRW